MPAPADDAPILLVPYDPRWPALFLAERALLQPLLAPWLAGPIEHIGSTAIPGLIAKPVIDLMAPVASLASSTAAIAALRPLDYLYAPYRADTEHWFCKPHPSARTHHLHLVPLGSPTWHSALAFRDRLRADSALAAAYATLKTRLATLHRHDREAYTAAKSDFITRLVRDASL